MDRVFFTITPRDPIIARDGRPFNSGNRMKAVDWIYPSVTAGSLRTLVGKALGRFEPDELRKVEVSGALPVRRDELYVPIPNDCVLRAESKEYPAAAFEVRPREVLAECSNLPDGLWPVMLPKDAGDDFKPANGPAFIRVGLMERWLSGGSWKYPFEPDDQVSKIEKDERSHVAIDAERGSAAESKLYSTTGLVLPRDVSLQVRTGGAGTVAGTHPLGGERRLASWTAAPAAKGWNCPAEVAKSLAKTSRVRLVLATPALFGKGWQPRWLSEGAAVPGTNVRLKLRGACVGRGRAISGWSMEDGRFGPKASRRMAPAGSVYFCEVTEGKAENLVSAWMEAVSDLDQDRKDGFGLAMWGVWTERENS